MYLFSVSRTKPNGLDDEYVIMESIIKNSIDSYKRLFLDKNEYLWESEHSKDFLKFQVIKLDGFRDKTLISVRILDYKWDGISKKLLDSTGVMVITRLMKKSLYFDFSICSINDFDFYIINENKFRLPEKRKPFQSEFKIYTGRGGFETLRNSSYLFSDDTSDLLKSYEMALGVNKRK
jgi:hypothetical protein